MQSSGNGSGGITIGATITGTCGNGFAVYNNGGIIGCIPLAGGSGTVTTLSVVSANGFAGTVANATSTPAITLTTTLTGVVKGNGSALVVALAGTDYLAPTGSGAALTGLAWSQIGSTPTTRAGYGITDALTNALPSADINVGNGSGLAVPVAVSGDATLANTGAITVSKTGGVAFGALATVTPGLGVTTALQATANESGGIVTSAQTYIASIPVSWDSNTTVANATIPILNPQWAGGGTIASVTYYTNGSSTPSFTANMQIGGTGVTSCNALSVSSSTAATTTCTAANTFTSSSQLTLVITGVSGTPNQALVQINMTHTAN